MTPGSRLQICHPVKKTGYKAPNAYGAKKPFDGSTYVPAPVLSFPLAPLLPSPDYRQAGLPRAGMRPLNGHACGPSCLRVL